MATEAVKPREVHATFNYFHDTGKPLIPMVIGGPDKPKPQPKIQCPVTITDVTGNEDNYRLEKQGFQYINHKSCLENFDDIDKIKKDYYPEVEELVRKVILETKELPPPASVHVLTHIIRRGQVDKNTITPGAGPLYGVHVDQSFAAVTGVAGRWLGDAAEELLQKPRFMLINTWRPLHRVTRDPFAVSDAKSIPDSDLVYVPVIFPDHKTEALEVKPAPADRPPHKWYYKQNMTSDEILFFKQIDSCVDADVPRRVPHCAFNDPSLAEGSGEPRVSIEVRVMVFFDSVRP